MATPSQPELPLLARGRVRPRRLAYGVDFSSADTSDLFDEPRANSMEGPRDPRLRRAIEAAACGWVRERI